MIIPDISPFFNALGIFKGTSQLSKHKTREYKREFRDSLGKIQTHNKLDFKKLKKYKQFWEF